MALYDLVTLRQVLTQSLNADLVITELLVLRDRIAAIKNQVPVLGEDHKKYINDLVSHYDQLITLANKPVEGLTEHIQEINAQIETITHNLFKGNYELETLYGTVDSVRSVRRISVTAEVEQLVKQKIFLHTSWRYPALEIGCRDGEWTQFLVAADPLYIMDRHSEFLDSANSRFTPEYQRRLRKYQLVNHNLSVLPTQQFSFVFSWGYFNYVSMDTMQQYLKQIFKLLRPGGTFFFTYNDGDTPTGAGHAEHFGQTYVPKGLLVPLSESLGYNIIESVNINTNINWLEIKKPGILQTNKAHQALGEILPRKD